MQLDFAPPSNTVFYMDAAADRSRDLEVPARDGFDLAATLFEPEGGSRRVVIINSATAVPRRFYRHFAAELAAAGYTALTYDYRGIGGSRPKSLRGFDARVDDWALQDMAGVVDWVGEELQAERIFLVGHSVGGQVAGLLDNAQAVDGMVTFSSQSGYWAMQGAEQKITTCFHVHVTLPLASHLFGYMPWSKVGSAEDLPKGAALQWARWCRDPEYLLGDPELPLDRYRRFQAPVLAYSIDDDKWGTARSVDAMMTPYPHLERRHLEPPRAGLPPLGHFGYFRPASRPLWSEPIAWLDSRG